MSASTASTPGASFPGLSCTAPAPSVGRNLAAFLLPQGLKVLPLQNLPPLTLTRLQEVFLPKKQEELGATLKGELLSLSVGLVASRDSYSRPSTRCLPLLGPAAQEEVRAVAAVQTLQAANQPPLLVSSQGHLVPQVVNKLPPQLPSSRPGVHLRVRRMRAPLPPGGQGWTQSLLTLTSTDLRCLGLLDNYY